MGAEEDEGEVEEDADEEDAEGEGDEDHVDKVEAAVARGSCKVDASKKKSEKVEHKPGLCR